MKKKFLKAGIVFMLLLLAGTAVFLSCNLDNTEDIGAEDVMEEGRDGQINGTTKDGSYQPFGDILGKNGQECWIHASGAYEYFMDTLYHEVGSDKAYILDNHFNDVRSEGMSYGMMLAVQMNDKTRFKRLWKFAKTYMQYKDGDTCGEYAPQYEVSGFFRWAVYPSGVSGKNVGDVKEKGIAPDGEVYFTMALIFAYNRWNIKEYKDAARSLLIKMANYSSKDENNLSLFYSNNLIKHWPIDNRHLKKYNPQKELEVTNPSYMVPAFFNLYIDFLPSSWKLRNKYADIRDDSREFLKKVIDQSPYKLPSQRTSFNGKPSTSYQTDEAQFCYDAWRVAMNIVLDVDWNGTSAYGKNWLKTYADKFCKFFESKNTNGKRNYKELWNIDGTKDSDQSQHKIGLVAMNAMAACLIPDYYGMKSMRMKRFMQELWDFDFRTETNYYNLCLYTFAMLWGTGNYNVY